MESSGRQGPLRLEGGLVCREGHEAKSGRMETRLIKAFQLKETT